MSEQSPFKPPGSDENDSSEAQRALAKERHLPLTGWQQEVDKGLEYGLEAAESINEPNYFHLFARRITSLCRD